MEMTLNPFEEYQKSINDRLFHSIQYSSIYLFVFGFLLSIVGIAFDRSAVWGFGLGFIWFGIFQSVSLSLFYFPFVKDKLNELRRFFDQEILKHAKNKRSKKRK
jgi:hypothetical protein